MSNIWGILCILAFATVAYGQTVLPIPSPVNLYNSDQNVQELSAENFESFVHCTGKKLTECPAYVVEFYASDSEGSANYTTPFRTSAQFAAAWKHNIVQFAAVNCRTPANVELCKVQGFNEDPLLKYYFRHSPIDYMGRSFESKSDYKDILARVSNEINREYWTNLYADWPNFNELPNYVNFTNDIWEGLDVTNCTSEYFLILVESMEDYGGMNLLIKTQKLNVTGLPIRRVSKDHELIQFINGTINYPEPIMFKRPISGNCTVSVDAIGVSNYPRVVDSYGSGTGSSYDTSYQNGTIIIERRTDPLKVQG